MYEYGGNEITYDTLQIKLMECTRMKGNHWMDIRNDRKKGLSYTEIARKYHIDPRTAKKYSESDTKPV